MGANNGKQYGSEGEWAARPHTPESPSPPPFFSPSHLGRKVLARCHGAHPFGTLSGPSPSPLAQSTQAPGGYFPTVGVPLSNFPGCRWDGSSCIADMFLKHVPQLSFSGHLRFRMMVWQMAEDVFQN